MDFLFSLIYSFINLAYWSAMRLLQSSLLKIISLLYIYASICIHSNKYSFGMLIHVFKEVRLFFDKKITVLPVSRALDKNLSNPG